MILVSLQQAAHKISSVLECMLFRLHLFKKTKNLTKKTLSGIF